MDSFIGLFDPSCSDEQVGTSALENSAGRKSNHMENDFPPEPQIGNIEYKLKLVNPTRQRLEHLVTQMNWRLNEGHGEAIYEIGVEDCGRLKGISISEMKASLQTLNEMAEKLGATVTVLRQTVVGDKMRGKHTKMVAEVLIRKVSDDQSSVEVRIAVMGLENSGKSTLLGVLTNGELDDGKGMARLQMFRHKHELQTGQTSSISHELIGFDCQGRMINYQDGSPECILEMSSKVVTLIDLAGHLKYLRTTLHGITGYSPHYIFFVLSAAGLTKMAMEHLTLAAALQISLVIIISKTDLVTEDRLDETVDEIIEHLNGICQKEAFRISSEDDIISFVEKHHYDQVVPIICLSCVSGFGLDLITKLLHLIPPTLSANDRDRLEKELPVFQVDETFTIPQKGIILGGLMKQGVLKEGTQLLLGPFYDGAFLPIGVKSIRRHKTPCLIIKASQSASLSLENDIVGLRKGMVLVSPQLSPKAIYYFKASISVLYHSTAISKGFQTTVHIGNVRQTAKIEEILSVSRLTTNDRAVVLFRFIKHPEYIQVGSSLLFRDGLIYGIGTVTDIFPIEQPSIASRSTQSKFCLK